MEEKQSTISGSGASDTQSPPAPMSIAPPQQVMMGFNMVAGTPRIRDAIAAAPSGSGGGVALGSEKKRGRPRKYDADGNLLVQHQTASSISTPPGFASSSSSSGKRGRGRPPGSGNRQVLSPLGEQSSSTAGGNFTPHVVIVNTGEDIGGKILSLAQNGPGGLCILSATGVVSSVTIRQPGSSGGVLTYEGRFEILTLTGSFILLDQGGTRSRTGGMSVTLSGSDGHVIGGGIAGLLTAAGPIQIVVGSFTPNCNKAHKKKQQREQTLTTSTSPPYAHGPVTMATPISQSIPVGEVSATPASKFAFTGQNQGEASQATENPIRERLPMNATTTLFSNWNSPETAPNQRPYPDMNILAPSE